MWIMSQDNTAIANSNNIEFIDFDEFDPLYDEKNTKFVIQIDGVIFGEFLTENEARKELNQIYDALSSEQDSYSIG